MSTANLPPSDEIQKSEQLLQSPLDFIQDYFANFSKQELLSQIQGNSPHFSQQSQQSSAQTEQEKSNDFVNYVESILATMGGGLPQVPRLNDCSSVQDVLDLNHKLVQFDCQIQDQFDEEFYIYYLPQKEAAPSTVEATVPNSGEENSPGKPQGTAKMPNHKGFIVKYFNEMTEEQSRIYGDSAPLMGQHGSMPADNYMHERGNALGVSIKNVNGWVQQAMNRPLQAQNDGISCLLKLYDQNMTKFKLNELCTFVGILEFKNDTNQQKQDGSVPDDQIDQIQSSTQIPNDPGFEDELLNGIPNEDKLPKLHVITADYYQILRNQQLLQQLKIDMQKLKNQLEEEKEKKEEKENVSVLQEFRQNLFQTQQKLLAVLKLLLKGDQVASQYLLLNLISKVHTRLPEGTPIGHLNINISGLSNTEAKQLQSFIELIVPFQLNLFFTTESLSKMRFQPKKNYDTNQLEPGLFQTMNGTRVVCNETQMNEGKIQDNGIENIKAIAELIENQKVVYDFQYIQQDNPISASVLLLSQSKSMFSNAIHVPLKGQRSADEQSEDQQKIEQIFADQGLLNTFRQFILLQSDLSEDTLENYYSMTQECQAFAQQIFMTKRQQEVSQQEEAEKGSALQTDQQTFHNWLVLARLLTISEGAIEMEPRHFQTAVDLDEQRLKRAQENKQKIV